MRNDTKLSSTRHTAACRIMRDLEGYVYDVSYYCPRQLDELREARRRGGARTPGGESYKVCVCVCVCVCVLENENETPVSHPCAVTVCVCVCVCVYAHRRECVCV